MLVRRIGPFTIAKRAKYFELRQGRSIMSQHYKFYDAEDAALRSWLGKACEEEFQDEYFSDYGADRSY